MAEGLLRYQIMEPLGRGSQGHTFRAIDKDENRTVAIKAVSLRAMDDWKSFDLFEREANILQRLDHPCIPKFHDSFAVEKTGDYFLVMEFVEGRTLHERMLDEDPLTPAELRAVLDQLLDVLEYLHGLTPPVIHRDIKPANVMLRADNKVCLVDFGGVRVAASPEGGSTMIGTLGYMAPEQLHGEASPATDLYSLAATIIAIHAGKPADELPFQGLKIDTMAVMPPSRLREVLDAMLEPDPTERLQSAAAVRRALRLPREGGRAQGSRRPSKKRGRSTSTSVPVVLSPGVQAAARTPAPFSLFVWLFSAMATVALVIGEAALVPLYGALVRAFSSDANAANAEISRVSLATQNQRRSMQYLAGATYPLGDEVRSLPPSPEERDQG